MRALDRFQWMALLCCALTFALVGIGATKRVLHVSAGPLEALNRGAGMVVGLVLLVALGLALAHHRARPAVILAVCTALVGVGVAGALGLRAWPHEQAPWRVSAQFGAAAAVVSSLLLATLWASLPGATARRPKMAAATATALLLVVAQATLGTQLRGGIEVTAKTMPELPRDQWLEHAMFPALAHLSFGPLVFFAVTALLFGATTRDLSSRCVQIAVGLAIALVGTGIALARTGLPPLAQVLHVLLALSLCGALSVACAASTRGARA